MESELRPTLGHEAFRILEASSSSSSNWQRLSSNIVDCDSLILLNENLFTSSDLDVTLLAEGHFTIVISDNESFQKLVFTLLS